MDRTVHRCGGKRRAKQFDTKKNADAYCQKIEDELGKGLHVPAAASVTVEAAAQNWLDWCEERLRRRQRMTRATLHNYKAATKCHIVAHLGERRRDTSSPRTGCRISASAAPSAAESTC